MSHPGGPPRAETKGARNRRAKLKDNRKSERVDSRLRCWCEGDNVTFYARVGNLSEGGLFLRTSTPLSRGTHAIVRLQGQGEPSEEVRAEATVVWTREQHLGGPAGMGLRFEGLDPKIIGAIRRIMAIELRSKSGHN
jgi:uncharacterized protein (TIGR02266 family)